VVAAFDVVEHCDPEAAVLNELARVLTPGGRLLLSVPAYQWAWTRFDGLSGHHRRYTRSRAVNAVRSVGMRVDRATYAFMSVFPFFATDRLLRGSERDSRI
jgi:SAM-dependent methyltransferase